MNNIEVLAAAVEPFRTVTMNALTAEELDELFDAGEDITEHLDLTTLTRPGLKASVRPASAESAPTPEK